MKPWHHCAPDRIMARTNSGGDYMISWLRLHYPKAEIRTWRQTRVGQQSPCGCSSV